MWNVAISGIDLYHIISWFFIYSFLGWVWETCYVSFKEERYVNRGFINGPLCTIYGFGAVFIYLILRPVEGNLLLLFVGGILVATVLEYFTAVLMESIFHTSWWDYSDQKFNFQGRICLGASLGWGLASVILFRVLHPVVEDFVELYPRSLGETGICVAAVLYAADFIYSAASAFHLRTRLEVWEQSLERLQGEVLLKVHSRMGAWVEKRGLSVENLRERLEDVEILRELEEKRLALKKELSREAEEKKKLLASKLDHNLRRYLKSYPHLNRGYRLHHQKKKDKKNENKRP